MSWGCWLAAEEMALRHPPPALNWVLRHPDAALIRDERRLTPSGTGSRSPIRGKGPTKEADSAPSPPALRADNGILRAQINH